MANGHELDKPAIYKIMILGTLDPQWSGWFDGFAIETQPEDRTLLTGIVIDQAALFGLLLKLHNLGLQLLFVQRQMENEPLIVRHGSPS